MYERRSGDICSVRYIEVSHRLRVLFQSLIFEVCELHVPALARARLSRSPAVAIEFSSLPLADRGLERKVYSPSAIQFPRKQFFEIVFVGAR